jgi:hypothetical protein
MIDNMQLAKEREREREREKKKRQAVVDVAI